MRWVWECRPSITGSNLGAELTTVSVLVYLAPLTCVSCVYCVAKASWRIQLALATKWGYSVTVSMEEENS